MRRLIHVLAGGSGITQLGNSALVISFQNDVDHAGNGVRTVGRRGAVHQDVDTVEGYRGDDRRVQCAAAERLRHKSHAVDHQERANPGIVVQSADVNTRPFIDVRSRIGSDGARRHIGGWDVAEQVGRCERARLSEILRAQIGHRHTDSRSAVNERASNQHLLWNPLGRLGHLGLYHLLLLRLRGGCVGHRQQRCRP